MLEWWTTHLPWWDYYLLPVSKTSHVTPRYIHLPRAHKIKNKILKIFPLKFNLTNKLYVRFPFLKKLLKHFMLTEKKNSQCYLRRSFLGKIIAASPGMLPVRTPVGSPMRNQTWWILLTQTRKSTSIFPTQWHTAEWVWRFRSSETTPSSHSWDTGECMGTCV